VKRTILALLAAAALAPFSAYGALHGDYLVDSLALRQDIMRQETVYRILKSEAETGIVEQKGQATRAWFQAKQEGADDKGGDVSRIYEPIREAQLDLGYRNLESISLALLREAQATLAKGNRGRAVAKADIAALLSPDHPTVKRTQSLIHLRSGSLLQGARFAFDSVLLSATYLWSNVPFLINVVYRFVFTLSLLLLAVALALVVKAFPVLVREVEGILFEGLPGKLIGGGFWLGLLCLPLFLGAGALWTAVIAGAVVYRHCSREERRLLMVLTGCLAVVPLLLHLVAAPFAALSDPGVEALLKVRYGAFTRSDIGYLQQISRERSGDPWPRFALGLGHKKRGEYRESEKVYGELLSLPLPSGIQAKLRVNVGNVRYARHEFEAALVEYKAALALDEDMASAHYNASQVYKQFIQLDDGDREFLLARKLDEKRVSAYAATGTPHPNRAVIDENITVGGALATITGYRGPQTEKVRRELVEVFLPGLLLRWAPGLSWAQGLLAIAIAMLIAFLGTLLPGMSRCAKCGRVSHPDKDEEKSGLCSQCRSVFQERDGVGAKARLTKMVEVRNHQRMQQRIATGISLLLPGAGHLYAGKGWVKGPVLFFLFAFGALALLDVGRLVPPLHYPLFLASSPLFLLVFLAAVYVGAQVDFRR
jgi:tetratricopeptide (TPR) repeat protein